MGIVPAASQADRRHTVKLVGSVLRVDGRPMFPRAVQHRGEPLAVLKSMGFNTVWLQRLPAPEMLEEADRLGLWLICPPPRDGDADGRHRPGVRSRAGLGLGQRSDRRRTGIDAALGRPGPGGGPSREPADDLPPAADLRGYSRAADLLLIDRRPLGTSLE